MVKNMESAQVDIDVDQTQYNCTRIATTMQIPWAFNGMNALSAALGSCNAKFMIASGLPIETGLTLKFDDKPILCQCHELIIALFDSENAFIWYTIMSRKYPHIAVSFAHAIGAIIAKNNQSRCIERDHP